MRNKWMLVCAALAFVCATAEPAAAQGRGCKILYRIAKASYVFGAANDTITTTAAVASNRGRELNPTFTPIIERWGIIPAMSIKSMEHYAIVKGWDKMATQHSCIAGWSMLGMSAVVNYAAANNYKIFKANGKPRF